MISQDEIIDIRDRLQRSLAWTADIVTRDQIRDMLDTIELLRSVLEARSELDSVRAWVMFMVVREMRDQDREYGYPRKLSDGEKIKILAEETGEVARAMQDGDRKHLIHEYVQVAACAIQHAVIVEQEGEDYAP